MTYNQIVSELDHFTDLGLLELKRCVERKLEEREAEDDEDKEDDLAA